MRIYLSGTRSVVYSTLQLMSQNGIPFTRYTHYHDGFIISKGSRKVLSEWDRDNKKTLCSYCVNIRKSDLELIMLSSMATVTL